MKLKSNTNAFGLWFGLENSCLIFSRRTRLWRKKMSRIELRSCMIQNLQISDLCQLAAHNLYLPLNFCVLWKGWPYGSSNVNQANLANKQSSTHSYVALNFPFGFLVLFCWAFFSSKLESVYCYCTFFSLKIIGNDDQWDFFFWSWL